MSSAKLLVGALTLLMRYDLTGCSHAASQAATLLDRLSDLPELDRDTHRLCDQMSIKLAHHALKSCA